MTDVFDKDKRSQIMSSIRSKNTVAEKIVFSYLNKNKIYYQKHYSRVPGKPDVALPRKKKAVFIDGDFWHGREFERVCEGREADDYWVIKISTNMIRDTKQRKQLRAEGWSILCIWESDIKRIRTRQAELDKIIAFLTS